MIYELVFGTSQGKVQCVFHDDTRASAGIGPNGEYNCFACGAKAHDEIGFISKYFGVSLKYATRIKTSLETSQKYKYGNLSLETYQLDYLHRIGLIDPIINKYFFKSSTGKLFYNHTWNGIRIGTTWFNNPSLPNHNAGEEKYKYGPGVIAGMLTPYDDVMKYNTLIITEGEKDMLTAKSMGIPNAVAKLGGAISHVIAGHNVDNKNILLVYDCDDAGRNGMTTDANSLKEHGCKVKTINLGLQDKEDLNDYFIKYKHTVQEFYDLIKSTPEYIYVPETPRSRFQKFVASLSIDEIAELEQILNERKGEITNEQPVIKANS